MRRARWLDRLGEPWRRLIERLDGPARETVRAALWRRRAYLVVTPGDRLIAEALAGYPDEVRGLCADVRLFRYDDRGGGGFYPDRGEIWLAAGVETYEGRAQVARSARHELFHYVCWNHPAYRIDEGRGFPYLLRAIERSRPHLDRYDRYRRWLVGSFIPQGDHANVVEYFADIPTNFPRLEELPPPIADHFAPLIAGTPSPLDLTAEPDWAPLPDELRAPPGFHRLLADEWLDRAEVI